MEGHHNVIVIIGASIVTVLVVLVLVLILYMIKLAKCFKEKNGEADKKIEEIKELKTSWSNLEGEIKSLVQEINQAKVRMQESSRSSQGYSSAPAAEAEGEFQRRGTMVTASRRIKPDWGVDTYTFNINQPT